MIKSLGVKIGRDNKEILRQYKEFKIKHPDGMVSSYLGVLLVDQEHVVFAIKKMFLISK